MLSRRSPMWLACVLAVATAGCGATSINQVLADPARYRNQTITVRGTVSDSATILGRGAYRIADGDQGLWVVTTGGAPRKGARVEVTGRLQEGIRSERIRWHRQATEFDPKRDRAGRVLAQST